MHSFIETNTPGRYQQPFLLLLFLSSYLHLPLIYLYLKHRYCYLYEYCRHTFLQLPIIVSFFENSHIWQNQRDQVWSIPSNGFRFVFSKKMSFVLCSVFRTKSTHILFEVWPQTKRMEGLKTHIHRAMFWTLKQRNSATTVAKKYVCDSVIITDRVATYFFIKFSSWRLELHRWIKTRSPVRFRRWRTISVSETKTIVNNEGISEEVEDTANHCKAGKFAMICPSCDQGEQRSRPNVKSLLSPQQN